MDINNTEKRKTTCKHHEFKNHLFDGKINKINKYQLKKAKLAKNNLFNLSI